ncbi:hypothetical protein pah_c022o164 [Parachlamydia acanthamoebae str. Hall's coccus]|nr:hypothetical protein pah_c022o164 [Parachlamydia acanthamoebae str. Hall's coccus]
MPQQGESHKKHTKNLFKIFLIVDKNCFQNFLEATMTTLIQVIFLENNLIKSSQC